MSKLSPNLSPREKKLGLLVGAVLLGLGGYHLAFRPLAALLEKLDRNVQTTEAKFLKLVKIMHREAAINAEYQRLAPTHEAQGADEEIISSMLRTVESMGRSAGVMITDIKPRPRRSEDPNKRDFLLELDSDASMASLYRFLQDLESPQGSFAVIKLNISPKGREGQTLRAYLLLRRTFWI